MPAQLVPAIQTKATIPQFIKSLIVGWNKMYGHMPEKRNIAVIYAQWSLETGQGVACWNWNLGNVKYVAKPGDTEATKYCMLKNVWEIVNGKKVTFQPPHPATWFRAFDTLEEGIAHHFNFLRNQRYKIAWAAVESGDPVLFAKLLRQQGYYTAPEADYRALMVRYFNQFMNGKDFDNAIAAIAAESIPEPEPTPEPEPLPPVEIPVEPVPVVLEPTKPEEQLKTGFIEAIIQVLNKIFNAFKRN